MRATKESNRKYHKTNNGITLIALVITIIVMLILVAVTITMAVNGGLFEYAGRAGSQTNDAVKAEQELGSGRIKVGNIWYDSPQDYVDGIESEDQGYETGNEGKITAATIKGNENTYYGAVVTNYTLPEANTEEITWKIFHSDGENIYLIASNYVENVPNGAKGTPVGELGLYDVFFDYPAEELGAVDVNQHLARKWVEQDDYSNGAGAFLLDTNQWNSFFAGENAIYALRGAYPFFVQSVL